MGQVPSNRDIRDDLLRQKTDRQEMQKDEPMLQAARYTHNSKSKNLSEIRQSTAKKQGEDLIMQAHADQVAMPEALVSPHYQL